MTFEEVKKVTEILLEFLPNTLKLFAWTIVLSIPVGVLVTMLKKCRFKPISWLTNLYILVMRGTPLMLQIIAIYYAVPLIIASAAKQGKTGGVRTAVRYIVIRIVSRSKHSISSSQRS